MGYSISLLGDKDGFDKRIFFSSALTESDMAKNFEGFRAKASGVAKDHLPFRCPIRKTETEGRFELLIDERNLSYNFDSLMQFLSEVISEGLVKSAKVMDGGKFGASAYVVTPGISMKFDFFPVNDMMTRIQAGNLSFMDVLKNSKGEIFRDYMTKMAG